MNRRIIVIVIICLYPLLINGEEIDSLITYEQGSPLLGVAWLGLEFIGGPLWAYSQWWQDGIGKNPFKNIREQEPYIEDKLWHIHSGVMFAEFNYWVFNFYFGKDKPFLAMSLSFLILTAIELMDASEITGKWGLSILDQFANMAGIGFWYAKYKYPKIPMDIRVGFRDYRRSGIFFERMWQVSTDIKHQTHSRLDSYSALKVEIIVRPKRYLYIGGACSLKDTNGVGIEEDLFGITGGFDISLWAADKYRDKCFSKYLRTISRFTTFNISCTYWFNN